MVASPKTAPTSGEIPIDAIDCGDGYYIIQGVDGRGEAIYKSCKPRGEVCRFSWDYWQAIMYVDQFKNANTND